MYKAMLRYRESEEESWLAYSFESMMEAWECAMHRKAEGWGQIQLYKEMESEQILILELREGKEI